MSSSDEDDFKSHGVSLSAVLSVISKPHGAGGGGVVGVCLWRRMGGVASRRVPSMLPVEAFGVDFYKVMAGPRPAVVFRPREWRGARGTGGLNELTVAQLAKEIDGYAKGTVTAIYTTSDGGFTIQNLVDLVGALGEHVQVVDHVTLAEMVAQKEGIFRASAR